MMPAKDARIVIVGAGPAGVHMAHLLRARGYSDLTILEKSDRIGGKSYTVEHEGVYHELGTAYLSPDYVKVIDLLEFFGLDQFARYQGRTVWRAPGDPDGAEIAFEEWLMDEARGPISDTPEWLKRRLPKGFPDLVPDALINAAPALAIGALILRGIKRYNRLHEDLFGADYDGTLPKEMPDARFFERVRGSFADYLREHDLDILSPIFMMTQTVQGYGYLETIPAFYGLMWNTPAVMNVMARRLREASRAKGDASAPPATENAQQVRDSDNNDYLVLCSGWQNLWLRMVALYNLDVRLRQDITAVTRGPDGVTVSLTDRSGPEPVERTMRCDHLIVACPAPVALGFLDATPEEQAYFGALEAATFTSTAYRSTGQPGTRYLDSWFYELDPDHQHTLYSQRHTAAVGKPEVADVPPETPKVRVAAQYGEEAVTDARLREQFAARMDQLGAKDIDEIAWQRFQYFYRFSVEEIEAGYPWKIQDLQGQNRTWFIGSSVSFEAINNVIEYNWRLIRRFSR